MDSLEVTRPGKSQLFWAPATDTCHFFNPTLVFFSRSKFKFFLSVEKSGQAGLSLIFAEQKGNLDQRAEQAGT